MAPSPPPTRQTAHELALAALRDRLSTGALGPGDRIRQEALAAELGTSVIPVREALSTLQAEGLVRHLPHRGFRVATLTLEELSETYEIRGLLEDAIVRLATPRLDDGRLQVLHEAAAAMESHAADGDVAAMVAANRRFHFTIFEAADRPRMVDFIRILWQTTDAYRSMYYVGSQARDRVNDEHRSIVEALEQRDADRAVRELHAHRQHAVDDLALRLRSSALPEGPA